MSRALRCVVLHCAGDIHKLTTLSVALRTSNAELRPILVDSTLLCRVKRMESSDEELELVLLVALRRRQGKSIVAIMLVHVTVTIKIQHSHCNATTLE